MGRTDYYSTFCKYRDAYYQKLQAEYNTAIDNTVDDFKINAHNIFAQEVLRKREASFNNTLSNIPNFYHDIDFDTKINKRLNLPQHFNGKYAALKGKSNSLLKAIGEREGLSLMYEYWHKQDFHSIGDDDNPRHKAIYNSTTKIEWTGENKNAFVQLVYALHEKGYIRHESQGVTKLVSDFARLLNIELSKNWQSNLSKSINDRNADYKPTIFKDIENGFEAYRSRQINKKKKN